MMCSWSRVAARGLRASWSTPAATLPRGAMGLRSKAAAALKSKRGRVTKARSGAYMLLGRYQVDRLLRVKERNGEWVEAAGHSLQAG